MPLQRRIVRHTKTDNGKEAEVCTEGMGPEPVPQIGTGAHLAWIARNARKLKEECRSGGSGNKGNEKGNGKKGGKHIEEWKSMVKKLRETVEETNAMLEELLGVVKADNWAIGPSTQRHGHWIQEGQRRSCGRHYLGRRA